MAQTLNGAEGFADETLVSAGASGGTSGTAWDETAQESTTGATNGHGTIIADTARAAHGTVSYRITPASGGETTLRRFVTSDPLIQTSVYVWISAFPTADFTLIQQRGSTSSGHSAHGSLILRSTGKLRLLQAGGTLVSGSDSSANFPLSQWVRVEMLCLKGSTTSNGQLSYGGYLLDDTSVVSGLTFATTAANTGDPTTGTGDWVRSYIGQGSGGSLNTQGFWVDSMTIATGAHATGLGTLVWPPAAPPSVTGATKRVYTPEGWR
jgi:hypothetical protein